MATVENAIQSCGIYPGVHRQEVAEGMIVARRKLEEVDFPGLTFPRWTRA